MENKFINIVLCEPEIPHNTGAIGRTCVATNTRLHLVKPLGFSLEEKWLRRTGLDYWAHLNLEVHEDMADFYNYQQAENPLASIFYASTKAQKAYTDVEFKEGDYIVFGKESKGLSEELLLANEEKCIRIPMWGEMRSLNLSNAVAVVIYEAYRQLGFPDFNKEGHLHNLTWHKDIEKF